MRKAAGLIVYRRSLLPANESDQRDASAPTANVVVLILTNHEELN